MINIKKYELNEIKHKRREIYSEIFTMLENEFVFSSLEIKHVEKIYKLYDEKFFGNEIRTSLKESITFSFSSRMIRSAGKTLIYKKPPKYEIRMGTDFFINFDNTDATKSVGGVKVTDFLEAFLVVFEHELCHIVEFMNYNKSSCKNKLFKAMVYNLFGHTESSHRLPTNKDIAKERYDYNIGDEISFTYKGSNETGIIYRINKRATVLVRAAKGNYKDIKGNRYAKYYIPIEKLKKSS